MKFSWCFKNVSRVLQKVFSVFQGLVESISRVFQESFESILRVLEAVSREFQSRSRSLLFYGNFKNMSKKFEGSVMDIPKMFQRTSNVLIKFHGCFREMSRVFLW